ncbi:MAG: hypothetical protein AB3N13_13120 [Arenibacterium sp.]
MTLKTIFDRRRVLLGLAAASTAAAAPKTADAVSEKPELIRLADALPALVDSYTAQRDAVAQIVQDAAKVWPQAPREIVYFFEGSKPETDVRGAGISRVVFGRGNFSQVWNYGTPDAFRQQIAQHKAKIARIMKTKSKRGLRSEKMWLARMEVALPLSEKYCSEIETIRTASGYKPARENLTVAQEALKEHIAAIMEHQPRTMEGVVIQAQAIQAWQQVAPIQRHLDLDAMKWPARMAASVLAQGGAT